MAYFECLNELKLIVDLMYEDGLGGMWDSVSDTAEYGGLTQGDVVVDEHARENMEEVLEKVQNGQFAREWIAENQAGRPLHTQLRARRRTTRSRPSARNCAACSRGKMKKTTRRNRPR